MTAKTKAWLALGFAMSAMIGLLAGTLLGALALTRQNQQQVVDSWIVNTSLLAGTARSEAPNPPAVVSGLIAGSLDVQSRQLAARYDRLTREQRSALAAWANAARVVATAGSALPRDGAPLRAFADCLDAAHGDAGAFRACAQAHGLFAAAPSASARSAASASAR